MLELFDILRSGLKIFARLRFGSLAVIDFACVLAAIDFARVLAALIGPGISLDFAFNKAPGSTFLGGYTKDESPVITIQ